MVQIKFVAQMIKIGESKGVIVPKAIAHLMEKGKRYEFSVEDAVED